MLRHVSPPPCTPPDIHPPTPSSTPRFIPDPSPLPLERDVTQGRAPFIGSLTQRDETTTTTEIGEERKEERKKDERGGGKVCICLLGLIACNGIVAGRRKGSGKKTLKKGREEKGFVRTLRTDESKNPVW